MTINITNSPLVVYTRLSPNNSGRRVHVIDRITPHCVVGQCTAEGLGDWFANPSSKCSANYGIDRDGRVALYVDEGDRSWCSSSNENDQRAVTIECASDATAPFAFRDGVYKKLIELCIDICRRNGKRKLLWFGEKEKSLAYEPSADEMVLTVHRWFAAKDCPGEWLYSRLGELADAVTRGLAGEDVGEDEASVPVKPNYTPPIKNPITATFPPDPSVFLIQLIMQYNGYWDKPDGHKSKAFFDKLEQFVQDMKSC